MNMLPELQATKVIRVLITINFIVTIVSILVDLWSYYLESHTSVLVHWTNEVDHITQEPSTKVVLVGHLCICFIQAYATTLLYRAAYEERFLDFKRNFMLTFYLLAAEYGIFLAYLVLTWNHYVYLFITLTFVSLAYKSILCWPLYEFQQMLTPPIIISVGETYSSNINLYHARFLMVEPSNTNNTP